MEKPLYFINDKISSKEIKTNLEYEKVYRDVIKTLNEGQTCGTCMKINIIILLEWSQNE